MQNVRKFLGILAAGVVVATLLVPAAGAQPDEETDPVLAPSSVVPSPFDLAESTDTPYEDHEDSGDGVAPAPPAATSHTDPDADDQYGPIINHVHFDGRAIGPPLWVEDHGRAYFFAGSLLAAVDRDGDLIRLAQIDGVDAFIAPTITYADGSLFIWGEIGFRQLDPITLEVEETWQLTSSSPTFPTGLAVSPTHLVVSTFTGGLVRIDRTDGTQTGVGAVETETWGIRHHESWGPSVVQLTSDGIVRYDTSVTPAAEVDVLPGERLAEIASDGSILTLDDSTTLRRRSGLDFSLLSTTTIDDAGSNATVRFAPDSGLIFATTRLGTIDWYAEGGSRVGTMAGGGRFAIDDAGARLYRTSTGLGADLVLTVATTGPHPTSVDQALFRPSWTDTVTIDGWNLHGTDSVTVGGAPVPFTVLDPSDDHPSLLLDLSRSADAATDHVTIVLTGQRGSGRIELPTRAPRGWAPLTLRSVTVDADQRASEGYDVRCGTWSERGRLHAGRALVTLVPTLEQCEAHITTSGNVRAGFIDLARPGAYADIWRRAPFVSGRPHHILFVRRTEPAGAAFWLFTNPVGEAPDDVTYPFDVTCGTWSQRYQVPSGFGVRVQLPVNVGTSRCTARLAQLRGAEDVTSHQVGRRGILKSRNRSIQFALRTTDYLSFVIDHGGADLFAPVAVAAPGEDLGARANAGVVHIFPTSADGRLRGGREQTLRQGRAGIAGPAEAGDRFGEVIQAGDFDGDGFLDFAFGVPGEDLGRTRNAGVVQIVYGSDRGYRGGRTQTIHRDTPGVPGPVGRGDQFGAALAAVDFDGDGHLDLAIGVPGEDLPGAQNAGVVQVLFGSSDGLTTNRIEELSQVSPGCYTDPEAGDRFGSTLAGSGPLLVIGVPREDIRGKSNAGIIHVVDGLTGETIWDRQGGYTGDRDEPNDQFGSVLTMAGQALAVGVPLEDDGARRNVGIVHTYSIERSGVHETGELRWSGRTTGTRRGITGTRGGPGDKFGASLVIAPNEGNTGLEWLIVGAPGAMVSGRDGAGEIVYRAVFNGRVFTDVIDQNDGVPGSPTAGGALGSQVMWGPWGSVVTSAPGLPVAGRPGAGQVFSTTDLETFFGVDQSTAGVGTAPERNAAFGARVG